MEIVRTKDSGTLQYEIFINDDEREDCSACLSPGQAARFMVFERYRHADAALEHFANIGHLMEPIMATATVTGIPVLACPPDRLRASLLGTPNAEMRRNLTGDQPKLFEPWLAISEETALTK